MARNRSRWIRNVRDKVRESIRGQIGFKSMDMDGLRFIHSLKGAMFIFIFN